MNCQKLPHGRKPDFFETFQDGYVSFYYRISHRKGYLWVTRSKADGGRMFKGPRFFKMLSEARNYQHDLFHSRNRNRGA